MVESTKLISFVLVRYAIEFVELNSKVEMFYITNFENRVFY